MMPDYFSRTRLLLGDSLMDRLARTRVIVFGVGGVGSWCAEGLVRSGIGHLTIVDADRVGVSNVNRQLMATSSTVGRAKVDVLRERLLDIHPGADILALQTIYSDASYASFQLETYDYVIDAIDSLRDKASLILRASATPAVLFSSMGAALKVDPTKVQVAEFWDVRGCPLGAALRKKFRREETFPAKKFQCVFDAEVLPNRGKAPEGEDCSSGTSTKAVINGTLAPVTAIFGFTLSGLVLQDLYKRNP